MLSYLYMKQNKNLIIFIAIGVVAFMGWETFGLNTLIKDFTDAIPLISKDTSNLTAESVKEEAWQVVKSYTAYAKAHDLEGVRKLSHGLSDACLDQARREECNLRMDSAYYAISQFKESDFKHVLWNARKITLYTDYIDGTRYALYLIRDNSGVPKIAGMNQCMGNETIPDECSSL